MVFLTKEHQATIEALFNGDETLALIDSCSTASIISSVIAEDLGLAIDTNNACVLYTANGPLQTLGLAHFDLALYPLKIAYQHKWFKTSLIVYSWEPTFVKLSLESLSTLTL